MSDFRAAHPRERALGFLSITKIEARGEERRNASCMLARACMYMRFFVGREREVKVRAGMYLVHFL